MDSARTNKIFNVKTDIFAEFSYFKKNDMEISKTQEEIEKIQKKNSEKLKNSL